MKIGDYLRLDRNQGINQIYDIEDGLYILDDVYYDEWGDEATFLDEKDVIKSSPNIIDLIEVGDYVNGSYIYNIVNENKKTGQPRVLFAEEDGVLGNGDIKSIVTKEQFRSMEYKVSDNSD